MDEYIVKSLDELKENIKKTLLRTSGKPKLDKQGKTVVNKELYRFIVNNMHLTSEEIAKKNGIKVDSVRKFMHRHNLKKQDYLDERNKKICDMYKKGKSIEFISRKYNITSANIYYILKKYLKKRKRKIICKIEGEEQ